MTRKVPSRLNKAVGYTELVNMPSTSGSYSPMTTKSPKDKNTLLNRTDDANMSNNTDHAPEILIDDEMETIEQVIRNSMTVISGEDEDDEDDVLVDGRSDLVWKEVTGRHLKNFVFSKSDSGIKAYIYESHFDKGPADFYQLFINEAMLNMMVVETNRYANQCKAKEKAPKARVQHWYDTNITEMKKFIGILFWMGLCPYPSIECYWNKNMLYQNKLKSCMSRNRFQLLLRMWHFHNNEILTNDRLQKISPLTTMLIENFQAPVIPKESLCIDETLVPFRGRLTFKQYIKNKRHKFGIKLYKLCLEKGYTYNMLVYCGQDKVEGQSSSQNVVLKLAANLLKEGRTIYTDNYYTSVTLAHALLDKKTHLVGTLRSNRKLNPKEITQKKLRKGETVAAESTSGVVVQKWKDKRDVLTLSTKHTSELSKIKCGSTEKYKPPAVIDYNNHKAYIDLSDQMKAYNTCLRRGVKWYRKLAVELLTGTALVNAYVLHQEVTHDKMSVTKFKEILATELIGIDSLTHEEECGHILEDVGRNHRGRCSLCYEKLKAEVGRALAQSKTPRVKLRCNQCSKHYCLSCFFETHKCTK